MTLLVIQVCISLSPRIGYETTCWNGTGNKYAATVFNNNRLLLDLYGSNVEVDYRGYDVTVESFIRVLTGELESLAELIVEN